MNMNIKACFMALLVVLMAIYNYYTKAYPGYTHLGGIWANNHLVRISMLLLFCFVLIAYM